jgi:hypothetical protein
MILCSRVDVIAPTVTRNAYSCKASFSVNSHRNFRYRAAVASRSTSSQNAMQNR